MLKTWKKYCQHLGVIGLPQNVTSEPTTLPRFYSQQSFLVDAKCLLPFAGQSSSHQRQRPLPTPALACDPQHHRSPAPSQRAPQPLPSPRPGDPALPVVASTSALCTTLTSRRHMPCHLSCGTHLTHVAQSWPQHAHSRHAAAPAMQSSAETLMRPHTHHLLSTQLLCLATPIIMSCHLSLPEQCEPAGGVQKKRCQPGGSPSKLLVQYLVP